MDSPRKWSGSFGSAFSTCDLVFVDEVDNGVDTDREVEETLFQIRVEEGELPVRRTGVLILSVLFPGGDIYHRGFTPDEARRMAADLLDSAQMVDRHNEGLSRKRRRVPYQDAA